MLNQHIELIEQQGLYGEIESLEKLAHVFYFGYQAIEPDFARSAKLTHDVLSKAPERDLPNMLYGLLLLSGKGVAQDIEKAILHLKKCEEKLADCSNALGYIYYTAPTKESPIDPTEIKIWEQKKEVYKSVVKDVTAAYNKFKAAHKAGLPTASYNLGNYMLGSHKVENAYKFKEAYTYYNEACTRGHVLACYNIGMMHSAGVGTYQSCDVALRSMMIVKSAA